MPRIRTIKPEFFDDEDLCALPAVHRLCFIGLWCQADKAGRFEDRPLRLKARLFPFDDVDMDAVLADLARAGFVARYVVDGKRYACVKPSSWDKHQRPRPDEAESVLPSVDTADSDESVPTQCLGKERKGSGKEGRECALPLADAPPAVLTFPTVGQSGSEWGLMQGLVDSWADTFPALDVLGECRRARAWIDANPDRRKTARGMQKFLLRWLSRATDSFRGAVPERQKRPQREPGYADWWEECKALHGGTCTKQWDHATRIKTAAAS